MTDDQQHDTKPSARLDIRANWVTTLPMLILLLEQADATGHDFAVKELRKMATAADLFNDLVSHQGEIERIEAQRNKGNA